MRQLPCSHSPHSSFKFHNGKISRLRHRKGSGNQNTNSTSHFGKREFALTRVGFVSRHFSFWSRVALGESLGVKRSIPLQSGNSKSSALASFADSSEFFI